MPFVRFHLLVTSKGERDFIGRLLGAVDDVEKIRHPKNDLKNLRVGFDEREHGEAIVAQLDLDKVLDAPGTCRSLRTLVAWCIHRLGGEFSTRWRLSDGEFHPLTCGQIPSPPSPPRDHAPPRRAG